jgi:cyanophycin synthetase
MVLNETSQIFRVNARKTDAFDIYNLRHYEGSNFYINTSAIVFDFALTRYNEPLPLEDYISAVSKYYPHLRDEHYDSYTQLFARTVSEVGKLDMGLHLDRWSVISQPNAVEKIAVQALHQRTSREVVYCVWDWFEALSKDQSFDLSDQIEVLQGVFRQSVYGGPTVYALLRTAYERDIPTFYLWDEGLMQYSYGRKQVRGIATTFDCDSHLDSDFTTNKEDCKRFLDRLGFPVPKGEVVFLQQEALRVAERIGYPVAVKPVVGHKGIGVTAAVQDEAELEIAFERAVEAIAKDDPIRIIVEASISGADFRLLCVNGRFVAATERRPASVTGDGNSTIFELIQRENRTPARIDTPTSPLGKVKLDDSMENYLEEQGLSLDSVLEEDRIVYLRKVANLSAGGLSIDATRNIHPDNVILAQDVAQHFRLTCLGIDLITRDLSKSWKQGGLSIIEINAAPGIYMHLNPAIGESVDVTSHILHTFFESNSPTRIPTISFNRVSVQELQEIIDHILLQRPDWVIGAVCQDTVFVNRAEKMLNSEYNVNVQNLLRNPKLDLLIVEYREEILEREGMAYFGSNLVVLDNPTQPEMMLSRDVFEDSTVVIRRGDNISISRKGLMEQYQLGTAEPFSRAYLKELATVL